MSKTISIIVAVAEDLGIGHKNDLLAYISEDLKRFKKITTGNTIIMGRNTWDSLPRKPLPNRQNIVISSQKDIQFPGAIKVSSPEEAIAKCPDNSECFIIGGAMVYRSFYPLTNKLYLTKIQKKFEADTFFPDIDEKDWKIESESDVLLDEKTKLSYQYVDFIRS